MRIYSDTVGTTKGVSQNHIGRLTPYSRKPHESLHRVWHSAIVLLHEGRTAALNGMCSLRRLRISYGSQTGRSEALGSGACSRLAHSTLYQYRAEMTAELR